MNPESGTWFPESTAWGGGHGRNTDTVFMIGDAYLTLHPSRVLFNLKHVYARNQPQPSRENVRRSGIDRCNDRRARSLDVLPVSSHRITVRNCVFIYRLSLKSSTDIDHTLDRKGQMNCTAIPYIKIKITEIPLGKKLNNAIP